MTDLTEIQERLKGMDDLYASVGDDQPSGDFQAVIKRFDFFMGKSDGDAYLKAVLTIKNDPDFDGTDVESIFNLTDRNKIKWTRKFLATIGYDGDISSLIDGLEEYAGLPVSITIQVSDRINSFTGDPYLKVWVNQRLGEVHGPVSDVTDDEDVQALKAQSTSPYTADDDIPF
jgi:hypothetical protein